ncbi:FUSC family protein [Micromonospora sp. NBC_01699]|uniref:FUSC family protein n=1 Tax=Micromonospora sp. NBC_01699 TaxID=2975984 RepID=UPI002E2C73F7|nr:FUSC family protein [Micromonospora sp. NBC_01699]
MSGRAVAWLGRRDPGYRTIRRAVRLTLIGVFVFYGGIYLVGSITMALYAVFTVFAVGVLAHLPVTPWERARVLLAALPVAWVLVVFGTVLAAHIWAAVAGMLVVGFGVTFLGVGGPRLAGVAAGLQLFYILSSFGPYAPDTLGERLGGVTASTLLLVLAELVLWPDRVTLVRYPQRLASAAHAVASFLDVLADVLSDRVDPGPEPARRQALAGQAVNRLTFEELPATERPTSACRRDRAMRDAAVALREALDFAERLAVDTAVPGASAPTGSPPPPGVPGTPDSDLDRLLRRGADQIRAAGRTFVGEGEPIGAGEPLRLHRTIEEIRARPRGESAQEPGLSRLWLDAIVLRVVEQAPILATAARITARLPVGDLTRLPGQPHRPFEYAHRPVIALYWERLRVHLTPRSVHFQGAARIALALSAARVVAGYLNLQHGFWVLLATLTLLRTSAADTRTTLGPAVIGTVCGAAAGAGLLLVADRPEVYRGVLPVAMVLAFAVGPLLGLAWGQGFVTLLLTTLFAQIGPASLQIVQARFLDVVVGAVVGVLAGLLLWPRGGGGELRRSLSHYLDSAAASSEETVEVLTGRQPDRGELGRAQRAMVLAEASMIQYQAERPARRNEGVDWSAVLIAGHEMVRGGQARRDYRPPPYPELTDEVAGPLDDFAHRVRRAYGDVADQLRRGGRAYEVATPPAPDDLPARLRTLLGAGGTRAEALDLVDLEMWLICLTAHLDRIQTEVDGASRQLPLR